MQYQNNKLATIVVIRFDCFFMKGNQQAN